MKEKFLKLTNAVYKVLEFFPESDPLKNRAKDKALAIMENLVLINETSGWVSFQKEKVKVQLLEDIDVLLGYLFIAKSQGWLNSINFLIISNEYEKIKKDLPASVAPKVLRAGIEPGTQIAPKIVLNNEEGANKRDASSSFIKELSVRQKIIIEFLSKNEKAQVMDLQAVLPNVTKRTIRRDLDELLLIGKITRLGEFNQVFYKIK